MTVLNFPSTAGQPTDGSFTYTANGVVYRWDGEKWVSNTQSNAGGGGRSEPVHFDGPDAPDFESLIVGDQWYNTNDGRLYTYTLNADNDLVWIDASPDSQVPQFWERNGTTLEPTTAGDSVDIGSGNIVLQSNGGAVFANSAFQINNKGVLRIDTDTETSIDIQGGNQPNAMDAFRILAPNATVLADIKYDGSATFASVASQPIKIGENVSGNSRIRSMGTYTATTAGADNLVISNTGLFARHSSSLKYKKDVEALEDQYADNILNARPVWYRSKSGDDNPDHGFYGFIAEEIAELEPRLATYNADGEPESVLYAQFTPLLLNLIKRQNDRIEALEAEVQSLKGGN
jgi:hypothetical protein